MTGHECPGGGRTWWAHFEFPRINIEPIILCKKFESFARGACVELWKRYP